MVINIQQVLSMKIFVIFLLTSSLIHHVACESVQFPRRYDTEIDMQPPTVQTMTSIATVATGRPLGSKVMAVAKVVQHSGSRQKRFISSSKFDKINNVLLLIGGIFNPRYFCNIYQHAIILMQILSFFSDFYLIGLKTATGI